MIQMKKSDMAIACTIIALVLGGLLTGLAACQMGMMDGLDLGGTPTTILDSPTISGGYGAPYVIANPTSDDLTVKFGKRATGSVPLTQAMINDTFRDLHKLISAPHPGDVLTTIIDTNDYIDLLSILVAGYPTNAADTGSSSSGYGMGQINHVSPTPTTENMTLRLRVVGINSFKRDGTGNPGTTNANNPAATTPDHVVFQFQSSPGTRRMEAPPGTNNNGYAGSEMKTYLMTKFLPSLKTAAGLTDTMLWNPRRVVGDGGSGTIEDTLWLPTVWEVFGSNKSSISEDVENEANQARLGFAIESWLASPEEGSPNKFCFVDDGDIGSAAANAVRNFAPAFCVK